MSYWRIYCVTESIWTYGYLSITPTVCFNNVAHIVNSGSTQELVEASSTLSSAPQTVLSSTVESTSIGSGALVINGGISVAGTSYTGGINPTYINAVGSVYTTGDLISSNSSGSRVVIDCKNSQSPGGSLLFTNVNGVGDYRIGSGGDCQWLGGGGRSMQFGAWHQVIIRGGTATSTAMAQVNGSSSTYNCQIINTNNSIGLTVQGNGSQSVDLTQWTNSSATVLAKVTSDGNIVTNATTVSTSTTTGALQVAGGSGIAGNMNIGGNLSVAGGMSVHSTSVTGTYTVLTTDNYLCCSTASGSYTITLPANSGITGKMYCISKTTTDVNSLTIDPNGAETIGGNPSMVINIPFSSVTFVATGSTDWNILSVPVPIVNNLGNFTYPYGGVYGLGGLGNVTISVNTTLTSNSYYNNLTINSGITLNPGGFQIFVANKLTFVSGSSTIACNGGNASGITGGVAASPYADLVSGTYSTYLGGATAGANGRTTTGIGSNSTGYTSGNASVAGSGANGGNSSANSGGTAGLVTAITAKDGGSTLMDTLPNALGRGMVSFNYIAFNGATGAASGGLTAGTGTTLVSGAGGGGAGLVVLAARIIIAASGGIIQAKGGNGSNATAGSLGTASIGGGSSAGGGIVSIITSTPWSTLSNITVSVAAGTPGTGLGTGGLSGGTGSVGRIIINQI